MAEKVTNAMAFEDKKGRKQCEKRKSEMKQWIRQFIIDIYIGESK